MFSRIYSYSCDLAAVWWLFSRQLPVCCQVFLDQQMQGVRFLAFLFFLKGRGEMRSAIALHKRDALESN
jgi:hypothetical protein